MSVGLVVSPLMSGRVELEHSGFVRAVGKNFYF